MAQYGYGQSNSYDQRPGGAPSPHYGGYNSGPAMGRDDYEGSNVEMEPLTGTGTSFPRQQDPNAILNECRDISQGIQEIERAIGDIQTMQTALIHNPTSNDKQLQGATAELMAMYRNLTGRVKSVKMKPESGSSKNAPQVGKVDRDLKASHARYLRVEANYRGKLREQAERQYRIVYPDASETEVRRAVEEPSQQMFSQALMQSDRRGQAQSALSEVQSRHEAIQRINEQMSELGRLFTDMDNLVVQQEAAVVNIEMKGEEVVENMDKGTEQIAVAIKSARNTRKWKWWCLGISVLIIIIIVVVILIYKFVIQTPVTTTKAAKRFVLADTIPAIKLATSGHAVIPGQDFTPSSKLVVPGVEWTGDKLVVPGVDYVPGSRKSRRFAA